MSHSQNNQQLIREYLRAIGRKGGLKSRRRLSSKEAQDMVRTREARRAFKKYYAQCFWYMRRDRVIRPEDIPEIARGLRQNGGRDGFRLAAKLCR